MRKSAILKMQKAAGKIRRQRARVNVVANKRANKRVMGGAPKMKGMKAPKMTTGKVGSMRKTH